MKLRLFYRGEKEYRQKRKAIKRHDSDGETESEPEEKKVERRKKKFRLGLHEDQSFVDSPDAIYMWQFEATHPYTWLSGKYNPGPKLSEIIKIFRYCHYYYWFCWCFISPLASTTSWWRLLSLLGWFRICWIRHRTSYS